MPASRFRLRYVAYGLVALAALQAALSLSLSLRLVHRSLLAGLEQATGREWEVGRFDLSLWKGPRLQAFYVTVQDAPDFGAEFLLRADLLEAQPDWSALLRGHLVFSRIALERPSLNMVQSPSGAWNYQAWGARRAPAGSKSATASVSLAWLGIRDGRINFKRGPDKLPFALVEVNGSLSAGADGGWKIALRAQPFRAGVTLQDAGEFRLEGNLPAAGFAGPVQPGAGISARWERSSLPDALRLLFGRDFGVRGRMDTSFSLRGPGGAMPSAELAVEPVPAVSSPGEGDTAPRWSFEGVLRLAEVHRWDFPLAPGLPGLNLSVKGTASRDRRRWELTSIRLEGPRSNLRGYGEINRDAPSQAAMRVVTASIHLDDLLAWFRAFHPGVDPRCTLDGYLGADVELRGWPPAIEHATLVTTGARLNLPDQPPAALLRRAVVDADRGGAWSKDVPVAFAEAEPGLHLSGRMNWEPGWPFTAGVTGATTHLAELTRAIAALGLSPSTRPLQATGSANLRLKWTGTARPWQQETLGSIALDDVKFSGGPLRREISLGTARLDFQARERRIQFAGLRAFGGNSSGTLSAPTLAGPWLFRFAMDRLNPAQLVIGFSGEPPENSSLLSRILPAQAAAVVAREQPQWPSWLQGEGTIAAGSLAVGRLDLEHVRGSLRITGGGVFLESAQATLAGGRVRGEARAEFGPVPAYTVRAEFDGINAGALAALAVSSRLCCTGTGSGRLELNAAGWNRDALFASLKGSGSARIHAGALLTLDLPAALAGGSTRPGRTPLPQAYGEFSFANGHVWLDHLALDLPSGRVEGKGNVDFSGQLDVRLSPRKGESSKPPGEPRLQLKGTLATPLLAPASGPASQ